MKPGGEVELEDGTKRPMTLDEVNDAKKSLRDGNNGIFN
jgi:hypothetical protein